MNVLIILLYYNRPNLVHNALGSIRELNHGNIVEVVAIDDGSDIPLRSIVDMHYYDIIHKFKFYRIDDSKDQKEKQGGSRIGQFINLAIKESAADISLILCDDDALIPSVVKRTVRWFENNLSEQYGYYHLIDFNPLNALPDKNVSNNGLTNYTKSINPSGFLEKSQVVWRLHASKGSDIWFPYPMTYHYEEFFYREMFEKFGECKFMGFTGQYKARFNGQYLLRGCHYDGAEGRVG